MLRGAIAVFAAAGAALGAGTVAHADNNTFLDYLREHGYSGRYRDGFPVDPGRSILFGIMACNNLRNGWTVEQQLPRYWELPEFPLVVEAAQHELCPDTLPPEQRTP